MQEQGVALAAASTEDPTEDRGSFFFETQWQELCLSQSGEYDSDEEMQEQGVALAAASTEDPTEDGGSFFFETQWQELCLSIKIGKSLCTCLN
jgi:hypothetical protein